MNYDRLAAFEKIVVEYHGSGDEGWIEDIHPEPQIEGLQLSDELYAYVEQAAYDLLSKYFSGWEINEGSQGHITIDVKAQKMFFHHGWTVETTEWVDKEVV